jgi:DNA-binding MarR family transcriptional regulator
MPLRPDAARHAPLYDRRMPTPHRAPRRRPGQQAPDARPELGIPAARVLRKFRIVFNAVKTHFQQVEKRAGIGGAQLWALSVIRDQPGIGVSGLAQAMDIHQTTASNLVKALLALALIGAGKEGPDRRMVQLHVLPAGLRLLRKAPGPFHGVLPDALAQLDTKTLARLDKDLAILIEALQSDEAAAGVPLGQK